ncbi:perlucin-like protein [Ruditapes philippinarum]|uniref:perlucin-like protein n=1 Tax=Ruditapes philippinarum TaxID=129788 RepID=UPI00295BF7D0|nr:perlucin-like protein [Ruditapes philippinarum]
MIRAFWYDHLVCTMKVLYLYTIIAYILVQCRIFVGACCENGWITFEESCYLFDEDHQLNWTEATQTCASYGGSHVVTIENPDEFSFLQNHSKRLFKDATKRDNWFWLGATDGEIEGIWVWYTDRTLLSNGYTNWYPGQPETSDKNNQDCACLWGHESYTWHDYHCDRKSFFICEQSLNEPSIIG